MRKFILAATCTALALTTAPAMAKPHWKEHHNSRVYDSQGRYNEPHRLGRNDRIWRGNDGRYRCKRDNGTTGLVIGAAVGGLAGNRIAGSGDRTIGTIIGAVGGGLLGRAVDRGEVRCR